MNILDLISADITLRRTGKEYIGLCPFHSEKTPSFTVSPDKDLWYCFGCGLGGDAISWLRKHRGMSYQEACKVVGKELMAASRPPDQRMKVAILIEETVDVLLQEWALLAVEKASMRQFPGGWDLNEKLDHYVKEVKLMKMKNSLIATIDRTFP